MDKTTPNNEIVFKPRYNRRAGLALLLWPVSAAAFIFFLVDMLRTAAYYSEGLLVLIFALAALSPPFIYFRELRFGDELVVKRYLLPDVLIRYQDILSFQFFSLRSANARVALSGLQPKSFEELDKIIDKLIDTGRIKLKKRH